MKRKIIITLIVCVVFVLLLAGAGYFLLATEQGSQWLARTVINRFVKAREIDIGNFEGTLADEIVLENAVFENLKGLPEGSILRIQKLTARIVPFDPFNSKIQIINARLRLPFSDPIVLFGKYERGLMDFNVYSNSIDLKEILGFFDEPELDKVTGDLNDFDFYITGPLSDIAIKGDFVIQRLAYLSFILKEAPASASFQIVEQQGEYEPRGTLRIEKGKLTARKTTLKLTESRITLSSVPVMNVILDVRGTTRIGATEITVNLGGTQDKPELSVNSVPPLPEPRLLLMLATGQSWEGVETALQDQTLSPAAVREVANYLFFGGEDQTLAQRLGFKDIKILYDEETRGIGVTKSLTSGIDVGYQIKRETPKTEPSQLEQKVESDLKLNENISVSVEREIKQYQGPAAVDSEKETEDKILLKYKKKF